MPDSTRYCLALDLVDDPEKIRAYEVHHRRVWPEILEKIRGSGITGMEIYRAGNRLFMILETAPGFSLEKKAADDALDPVVREWETLMETYQQGLPFARPGEKWVLMAEIFNLKNA